MRAGEMGELSKCRVGEMGIILVGKMGVGKMAPTGDQIITCVGIFGYHF